MRKRIKMLSMLVVATIVGLCACGPNSVTDTTTYTYSYTLDSSHEVDGRQGVAWEDGRYYVSGSTSLSVYDADWSLIKTETEPFEGFDAEVNHIGDIDVYEGEIYAGVEYFMDGTASHIQMSVYDANTLKLARTFPFDPESGQTEVSGIAVDPDHGSIWMCSWAEDESGGFLYRYDLESGAYLGKAHLQDPPQYIQGIAYHDGWIYITADDGLADDNEPDHVYQCKVDPEADELAVTTAKTLDDVTRQGEIEGISFDREKEQMLVSYNRGAIIVKGMPKGFYEGYDSEIHEVFVYDIHADEVEQVKATVTLWSPQEDQTDEKGKWLQSQCEAFATAHPEWDLTFRYGVCPEGDAAKNIGTDPESSADIYMTSNDSIPDLLQDGSIVELGGIWADKIREANTETAVQTVTYEGGIYADGTMVGYVLVIYDYDVPEYDIWHMMIDESKQGRGYGSAALDRVIDYIRTKPFGSSDRVTLTCNKDNPHALRLYRAKDFVETGAEDDDEIELSLTLG